MAAELPEEVRYALFEWARPVCGASPALRQVPVDALHVTLCFLGDMTPEQVDPVRRVCRTASAFSAAPLATAQALWLPRRRPRVLSVELEDSVGLLGSLQARLAAELARTGTFTPEPRSFLPHVTLARVRGDAGRPPAELPAPPAISFAAEQVVLYRSHLGRGPARYEALHRVPLSRT